MGAKTLIDEKKAEVSNLASRYGVDRYIGTREFEMVDALVANWATGVEQNDPLTRETKWLDTKVEIEDIMADIAITNNSRESMFLLGASATGMVSMSEVIAAYVEGWNRILHQYSSQVSMLNKIDLENLERERDRFIASIPEFGSQTEKIEMAQSAQMHLSTVEEMLKEMGHQGLKRDIKLGLGERETTRALLLTEADAGFKDGTMTAADLQQVKNLIGRNGSSVFSSQLSAMNQYGNNAPMLMKELDRTLRRAGEVVSKKESRYALAGFSFVDDPRTAQTRSILGRTGMTGDGIRSVSREDRILQTIPQQVGFEFASPGPDGYPPKVGLPSSMHDHTQATVVPSKHTVHNAKFMNPADVHRNAPLESRFTAFHNSRNSPFFGTKESKASKSPALNAKLQGIYSKFGNTNGRPGLDYITDSTIVQLGIVAMLGVGLKTAIESVASRRKRNRSESPLIDDPFMS
jgi:hypothetical protein